MIGELPVILIFGGTKAPKSSTINADPGILAEGEVIKIEQHIDKYSSKVSK
jgi:predicted GTPase